LDSKAQIVRPLRPSEILHFRGPGLDFQNFAFALQIVNEDSMLVRVVNNSDVAAARRDRSAHDATTVLIQLESFDLFSIDGIPDVH